jgi:kynurenine formamidase
MQRWTNRPESSTWGDWGEDDEIGRLNLLTPERLLAAIAEVREGLSFCLSLPLDAPGGSLLNPRRKPPVISPTVGDTGERFNLRASQEDPRLVDVFSDDRVVLTLQYSTQWDGLSHVGAEFDVYGDGNLEPVYYNGFRAGADVVGPIDDASGDGRGHRSYARKLSVAQMAAKAVQGRGVLVDLAHHLGQSNEPVGFATLSEIMEADNVEIEPGDMLVLHTGFATAVLAMNLQPDPELVHSICPVLDGSDQRLLDWITESQVAAVIADNYAVEVVRHRETDERHSLLPLHHHCLFKLGVNLGEMWYLDGLAKWLRQRRRSRFLLTAPPLRLPGAVGSPLTPVATV